jgi:hypothetical protein
MEQTGTSSSCLKAIARAAAGAQCPATGVHYVLRQDSGGPKFPQSEPTRRIRRRGGPTVDVADTRIEESVAALQEFVAEHGSLLTDESWTEAAMRPSEKTIRCRFGSFREAIQRAALT